MKVWTVKEYLMAVAVRIVAALVATAFIIGWLFVMVINEDRMDGGRVESSSKEHGEDDSGSHGGRGSPELPK
jgi:hypothetical protein